MAGEKPSRVAEGLAQAVALVPLLESLDPALLQQMIHCSKGVAKSLRFRILTELSKDELIHFGNGNRSSVLTMLKAAGDEDGLENRWMRHVRATTAFVTSLKSDPNVNAKSDSDLGTIEPKSAPIKV